LHDRVAVYDRRSGRTHLLDPLTAEVLRLVLASPGTPIEQLRESLLAMLAVSSAELPASLIEDALAQLHSAGLDI
jgi:PqqD family protein of HPr-rel-A system